MRAAAFLLTLLLGPGGAEDWDNIQIPSAVSPGGQLNAGTIAANDTSPSVRGKIVWTTSANSVPTVITDLDNPVARQWVILIGGSNTNSSTIADSGNFALDNTKGGMTLSLDAWIMLYVQADNDYVEIGRGDNAAADLPSFGAGAFFHDDQAAMFGNSSAAPDCQIRWDTTGTDHLAIWCTDIDGIGGDGDVCYVDTGTRVWHCLGGLTIAGALSGVSSVDSTTESTIEAAIDTLANLSSVQSQTVSLSGALTVESGGCVCNQDLTTDASPTHSAMSLGTATADCGAFTMIRGAQTSDPQFSIGISADGVGTTTLATANGSNGDFQFTPSGGDVHITGSLDASATVQGEHVISTDDADINDNLTCGDLVVDEAAGVIAFTGGTSATINTSTADLTLAPVAGKAVVLKQTAYTVPATATVTANAAAIDWSVSDLQALDLQGATGTVTVTMTSPRTTGMALQIIQGTQLGTITLSPAANWAGGGGVPAITATNDAIDLMTCVYVGAAYYCGLQQGFAP